MKIAAISSQKGSFVIKRPRGVRRSQRPRLTGRSTVRVASATVLMGQPLAHEPWRGTRGNREVPPHLWKRGLVGETGFPPRERAKGERRSFLGHPHEGHIDDDEEADDQENRHADRRAVADMTVTHDSALSVDR